MKVSPFSQVTSNLNSSKEDNQDMYNLDVKISKAASQLKNEYETDTCQGTYGCASTNSSACDRTVTCGGTYSCQ